MGLSLDLCVLLCTLLAFHIVFFSWNGDVEPLTANFMSLLYFPLWISTETQCQFGFEGLLWFSGGVGFVDRRSVDCQRGPPAINQPLVGYPSFKEGYGIIIL